MSSRISVHNLTRVTLLGDRIVLADRPVMRLAGRLSASGFEPGEGRWLSGVARVHMLGVRYPLDVIFLGAEAGGVYPVVGLRPSMTPWRGAATVSGAVAALELAPGAIAGSSTQIGDLLAYGSRRED